MKLEKQEMQKIVELRHELHRHPELSGREIWTKQYLMSFLKDNTRLEIRDMGSWFYAYKKGKKEEQAIAFRADFDALPIEEKMELPYKSENVGISHKCGHDGHSAALCGTALLLDQMETERSIYFIFQPAEEIGQGGEVCADFVASHPISEVYAWHNRSGYPLHQILIKSGSIQCASKGLSVLFQGVKSHASEPEKGVNPAFAIAELVQKIAEIPPNAFIGRTLYTIIHMNVGKRDFGVSPGEGELSLTLRADLQSDLDALEEGIRNSAIELARKHGVQVRFEISDPFPDTSNDAACVEKIIESANLLDLEVEILDRPWKASEDFGYYTMKCPGAMFFIGTGEEQAPLHSEEYDFQDAVLSTAIAVMSSLVH